MTLTTYENRAPSIWDNFFEDYWSPAVNREISPRARVTHDEKAVNVELELPGVKKEDIKVEIENGILIITASKKSEEKKEGKGTYFNEISYGEYKRSFRLSDEVESDNIKANFENGVLKLELTKKEKAKPRLITIK